MQSKINPRAAVAESVGVLLVLASVLGAGVLPDRVTDRLWVAGDRLVLGRDRG